MSEHYSAMGTEVLQQKLDQAYEMAALARGDGDNTDYQQQMNDAKRIKAELQKRGVMK
jgi:hypothetical protein